MYRAIVHNEDTAGFRPRVHIVHEVANKADKSLPVVSTLTHGRINNTLATEGRQNGISRLHQLKEQSRGYAYEPSSTNKSRFRCCFLSLWSPTIQSICGTAINPTLVNKYEAIGRLVCNPITISRAQDFIPFCSHFRELRYC